MNLLGQLFGRNRQHSREPDASLNALLQQWQGPGARPDFEDAVWRRIRRASEPASSTVTVFGLARDLPRGLAGWLPDYGLRAAAAAVVGIVTGVWLAFAPGPAAREQDAATPLLHRDTLAGSYLSMLAGGPQ
jgi:hypothetical protein